MLSIFVLSMVSISKCFVLLRVTCFLCFASHNLYLQLLFTPSLSAVTKPSETPVDVQPTEASESPDSETARRLCNPDTELEPRYE